MGGERRDYRYVADEVARWILEGTQAPGSLLPSERELGRRFEVTRNIVREALLALEITGFVEVRNGIGAIVLGPSVRAGRPLLSETGSSPIQVLEARRLVEGEVAAEAARAATPEDIEALEEILAQIKAEPFPPPPQSDLPSVFHIRLAQATQNPLLVETVELLWSRVRGPLFEAMKRQTRLPENPARFHMRAEILEAVRRGDPDAARSAMHAHTDLVIRILFGMGEPRRPPENDGGR